ncbi:hypothetical protein HDC92_002089 [Pedobacter sp. AK017]|uniref:hypothetical protein n=1 Tax=Pedobacter sp. AK017 TaxID=2723073 RepID=UPI00180469C2|nr:hypothetical protein [Pedobacter sp. AK017]MBB5438413.1 hypothetical protein [Pedobacter sp. AK017]
MEDLKEKKKIPAFLSRIRAEWPGKIERFEFKTATVIYVYLKEGISSLDFSESLSMKMDRLVDFSIPLILYHVESDGFRLRSQPVNWYSSLEVRR